MDDSDTLRDGQDDDRFRSSGGAVKSNPPDGGRCVVVPNLPASAPAALTEDPFEHLTPVERFAKAIERRDALVRKLGQAGKK